MLCRAVECRDAQDGRNLFEYSCAAFSVYQPGAVP